MGNPLASQTSQRGLGWTKLPPPIHSRHSDPASVVPTSSLAMGSPVATTTLSTSSSGASLSSATSSSYSSPAQSFSSVTPINTSPRVKWKARDAVAKRVQESDEEEELDDDLDDDLDEFGYSSARRRAGQRETLIGWHCLLSDILNSGPPNWMQNPSRESVADTSSFRVKKRSGLFARTKQSAGISSHQPSGGTSESIAAALRKSIRISRSSGSLFRTGRVGSLGSVVTGSTSRMTRAQEQAQAADEFARSLDPDTRKISLQMAESPGSESLMSFLRSSNPDEECYTPGRSSHIGSPFQLPRLKPTSVGSSDKVQDVHESAPSPTRVFFRDLKVALEGNPMMTSQRGKRSTAGAHHSSGEWDAGMPEDASLAAQWVSGDELSRVDSLGVAEEEILASPPRSDPSTPRHLSYTAEELEKSPGARRRSIIATSAAGGSPISPSSSEGSSTTSRTTSQQFTSTARRISPNAIPKIEDTVSSLNHKPSERKYEPKHRPEDDTGPIATGESPIKGRSGSGSIASPGGDGSPFSRKSRHGVESTSQKADSSPCNKPRTSSKTPAASQSTKQGFPSVLPLVLSASSTSPSRTPVESESTSKLDAASDPTSKTDHTTKPRPENLIIPATSSADSTCASEQEMPTSAGCSPESGSRRRPPRRITPPPKTPLPNAPGGSGAQVQAISAGAEELPTKEEENGDSATDVVLEELPSGQSDGSSPDAWTSTREGQHSLSTPINDPKDASGVEVISALTPMHPRLLSALIELKTSMGETATLDLPEAATTLELVLPTLCGMRTQFRNAINVLEVLIQLSTADHEGTEGNVVECLLGE
ncbi:BZ3500_MvSof-1268-A1-R1_Chr1-3g01849 [Microbotryum saponariae]|uniref:BZ3500_MvSof-1268-A1-R1_Chr1-3g01849 protein n=1 Tax=Microbotryum saponariae TaxID=289078 RepID=A0A2X0KVD4_9BASI|nr:BZ3500_MvSof-1268-A1-R1_Chr1-3g01849 [Microbotryum saponariae]SCZ94738.1 BZ3501_MvSof-1269-A2-R1_Chr1-3g01451 [Microbotryum saponariae]